MARLARPEVPSDCLGDQPGLAGLAVEPGDQLRDVAWNFGREDRPVVRLQSTPKLGDDG